MSWRLFSLGLAAAAATACATNGAARLHYQRVDSAAMGRPMEYGVYTPPGYQAGESLPLVLFLHGGGDDAHCLDKEGVSAWLDEEISAGRVPRVVVAVPQGDRGFWANWADGSANYADWALTEVVGRVARDYGTQACPEGCHLMGISMGGNGALRAALANPGRFASAAVLSGPTLDSEQMQSMAQDWRWKLFVRMDRIFGPPTDVERRRRADPFQLWRKPDDLAGLRLFLTHGDRDREGIAESNAALHRHLAAHGIPHRYEVFRGGHRWKDWLPALAEALREAAGPPAPQAARLGTSSLESKR